MPGIRIFKFKFKLGNTNHKNKKWNRFKKFMLIIREIINNVRWQFNKLKIIKFNGIRNYKTLLIVQI